jgi:hypothetical protein
VSGYFEAEEGGEKPATEDWEKDFKASMSPTAPTEEAQ